MQDQNKKTEESPDLIQAVKDQDPNALAMLMSRMDGEEKELFIQAVSAVKASLKQKDEK